MSVSLILLTGIGAAHAAADRFPAASIKECDRLSAHPLDNQRTSSAVSPVPDLGGAISACRAALADNPGQARVLFQLAVRLAKAQARRKASDEVIGYLRRSVALGYPAAAYFLALERGKHRGYGRRIETFRLMLTAARGGNHAAQAVVSLYIGRANKAEEVEAVEWGEAAVGRGDVNAMFSVARAYILILSRPDKYARAIKMLMQAEAGGSREATALIGQFMVSDQIPKGLRQHIPLNTYGGLSRLKDIGGKGNKKAAFLLGLIYAGSNSNFSPDKRKMIDWFCRAGERGRYMVAEILERDVDTYRCPRAQGE
jgi:TPR repeat protein